MRTKLALLALAISSSATAETEPAPSDPYADSQPDSATAAPPITRPAPKPVTVRSGPLGIVALDISPELRMHLGAPRDRGVLVDAVLPNTLAAKAGLKVGDLVLDIDNTPVGAVRDVVATMGKHKKGDQIVLDVMRTGIPATLRATLDQDPPAPGFEPRTRAFGSSDMDRWFETTPGGGTDVRQLRQQLEEMRRRLDDMERRFEPRRPVPPSAESSS